MRRAGRRATVAAILAVVVCGALAVGAVTASDHAAGQEPGTVRFSVSRLPDQPGRVLVTATVAPEAGDEVRVRLTGRQEFVDGTGWTRDGSLFEWDRSVARPTLTYTVRVNETAGRYYDYVDTTNWTLTRSESLLVSRYPNYPATVSAAEGVATGNLTYLGPHETTTVARNGTTFRVVVSGAFDAEKPPDRIATILGETATFFEVGSQPDEQTVVLVPSPPVNCCGRAVGTDYVATNEYVVLHNHEYVHTRQQVDLGERMEWFEEASAFYHAPLASTVQGRFSYEDFEGIAHVSKRPERGGFDADLVSSPNATVGYAEQKYYGPHVLAALDARIRNATAGERTLTDVIRRMNAHEGELTYAEFQDIVARVAGTRLDRWLDLAITTDHLPAFPARKRLAGPETPVTVERIEVRSDGEWLQLEGRVRAGASAPVRYDGPGVVLEAVSNATIENGTLTVREGTVVLRARHYYNASRTATLRLRGVDPTTPTETVTETPTDTVSESTETPVPTGNSEKTTRSTSVRRETGTDSTQTGPGATDRTDRPDDEPGGATESVSTEGPGFTVPVALLAVVLAAGYRLRRETD